MKRILLIRHGQTDWNVEGRWQGHLQVPLNPIGLEQAHTLAAYLRVRPITAIYSSDLLRAHQTAEVMAEAFHLPVTDDSRWRELNLGLFQGLTMPEISAKFPLEFQRMHEDYLDFVYPQGESRRQLQARAYAAYRDIAAHAPGSLIAVVSHGGTIRALLMKLFTLDNEILHKAVHNTSISTIETEGESDRLIEAAETPHFGDGTEGDIRHREEL